MPLERVRAVVDGVRQSGGVTAVITREQVKKVDIRRRYRLAGVGESWKIVGIDHECFLCQGTGQAGDSRCQKYNGEGWYELDIDAV